MSTGRCGSTLLSSLLAQHPSALGIPELFAAVQPGAFPAADISGARFWSLLSKPRAAWTAALRGRMEPGEFRYPIDEGRRFDRRMGVPPILAVTLPALTRDPDHLYDELGMVVQEFPAAPIGVQYAALFDWLAGRFGKPSWIERSGGSLAYCGQIVEHFGRARFVHLHRAGTETALSMSRHAYFRMAIARDMLVGALGYDPYETNHSASSSVDLPHELTRLMPERFDPQALWDLPIPLERFGRAWSAMIINGTRRLAPLPTTEVLHLAYEDLVASPRTTLERVLAFFELPEPSESWYAAAAARVRPQPAEWPLLPEPEREALARACRPGDRRIAELQG